MCTEVIESPYEDNSTLVPNIDGEILKEAKETRAAGTILCSEAILPISRGVENVRVGLHQVLMSSLSVHADLGVRAIRSFEKFTGT
jgi:hypothetical protein